MKQVIKKLKLKMNNKTIIHFLSYFFVMTSFLYLKKAIVLLIAFMITFSCDRVDISLDLLINWQC